MRNKGFAISAGGGRGEEEEEEEEIKAPRMTRQMPERISPNFPTD
jgi:hypothetical protein